MSDKLLIDELLSLQCKMSEVISYVDRDEDGRRLLISHSVIQPQLEAMSRLLDALIQASGMGEKND